MTVAARDIVVTITEKPGQWKDTDAPALSASASKSAVIDHYEAALTGDIWMKVSHKYGPAEVDALVPLGTSAQVLAAVKSIYAGLKTTTLKVAVPAEEGAGSGSTLTVSFGDSENPKDNIVVYDLLADGLPRVHPGGYAALFNAAIAAKVDRLQLSSAWRPMLGSIAHRAGLGLDVSYVGPTRMNRLDLRSASAVHYGNVSEGERKAFAEFEAAKAEVAKARRVQTLASTVSDKKAATDSLRNAMAEENSQARKWEKELGRDDPPQVHAFRSSLMSCACVRQLFDPWYMDADTKDQKPAVPNLQATGNERLHAHHLHVTVADTKIL